jgi:hypothetical protein
MDIENFRAESSGKRRSRLYQKPPRHKQGELFLRGPIPWNWLSIAMDLPPTAVRVGLALWFLAGCKKSGEISPTWRTWRKCGVHRNSAYRGLEYLERAGLVSVKRHRGRCPIVTLQPAPIQEDA